MLVNASQTAQTAQTLDFLLLYIICMSLTYRPTLCAVDSGGAGGARAPPKFGGSEKGRSLISAYQSLSITTNTPGFEKLNTALL